MLTLCRGVDSGGGGQQAFKWQVQTYNTNLTFGHVYFLWLAPMDSQWTLTSHYFNITDQAQSKSGTTSSPAFASSTSLTSSTTAFTSSTSLASSITASSISSTPSQRSSQNPVTPSPGASSNTELLKIGFGVGLGIGVPLVLLAGMWIGLRLVRSRQSSSRSMKPSGPLSQVSKTEHPSNSYPDPNQVHEAPGGSHGIPEAPEGRAFFELGSRDT